MFLLSGNQISNKSFSAVKISWILKTLGLYPGILKDLNFMMILRIYFVCFILLMITSCGQAKPKDIHIHLHGIGTEAATKDGELCAQPPCTLAGELGQDRVWYCEVCETCIYTKCPDKCYVWPCWGEI